MIILTTEFTYISGCIISVIIAYILLVIISVEASSSASVEGGVIIVIFGGLWALNILLDTPHPLYCITSPLVFKFMVYIMVKFGIFFSSDMLIISATIDNAAIRDKSSVLNVCVMSLVMLINLFVSLKLYRYASILGGKVPKNCPVFDFERTSAFAWHKHIVQLNFYV